MQIFYLWETTRKTKSTKLDLRDKKGVAWT
jgi:hypothetical protein